MVEHCGSSARGGVLGLVLCNFQEQELVIPVSLWVANFPSCPTLGSDTFMPVGKLAFEILFCVKEKKEIKLGDFTLETLSTVFEETYFVGADCVIGRVEVGELHGVWEPASTSWGGGGTGLRNTPYLPWTSCIPSQAPDSHM